MTLIFISVGTGVPPRDDVMLVAAITHMWANLCSLSEERAIAGRGLGCAGLDAALFRSMHAKG